MNIIELELLSNNIAETGKFYKKVLGLNSISAYKDEIVISVGYTKLIFREVQNVKPVYHFALDVPNNRFDAAREAVKSKVKLLPLEKGEIADFKNWDAKSFYFYDNNENIVEVITRYGNRVFSDEPFSGGSFINVSEVGLVTRNVPELAGRLKGEFNIPVFHRQPPAEKFTVCGDDDGLFILAEKGREWYPVNVPSHSYYTRILFYQNGVVHHIVR